jgi:hypothetical protein
MRAVFFFFGKTLPKGDTVFWNQNILSQIPIFWKEIAYKQHKTVVFGEGIATFMPHGSSLRVL